MKYIFDEKEFFLLYGVCLLFCVYKDMFYILKVEGWEYCVDYVFGDLNSWFFGGNLNWCGLVWLLVNYLLIEVLECYYYFYGDMFMVEFLMGSGYWVMLK